MEKIVRYIIQFLLGKNVQEEFVKQIGYTSDVESFHHYKVVIVPSLFFDENIYLSPNSMPLLPLQQVEGVPLLFGTPQVVQSGKTLIVHADIIASSFFLLSRYEEIIRRCVRDEHGRFPGRESIPFKAGFISRPIVDEYGQLLRRWLSVTGIQLPEPLQIFRHINLTHDVDDPFECRKWRNVIGGIMKGKNPVSLIKTKCGVLENDPFYTFPWMLEQDWRVKTICGHDNCDIYLFFKAGGDGKEDIPHYNLRTKDIRQLVALCRNYNGVIGLHSSYRSGKEPALIFDEKNRLQKAFSQKIHANRHHYLTIREPEDMEALRQAGFTDDFTMGYADIAGFRLGTARPVHWINASARTISELILHPLTIMDCTLSEPEYMGFTFAEAQDYCFRLIDRTRQVNGEVNLLWHNTMVVEGVGYMKMLYGNLLKKINEDYNNFRRSPAMY